jgi:hypothetical protein
MPQTAVRVSIHRLREMDAKHMRLWATPGEAEPYWAEAPRFPIDVEVALPQDFISAHGYTAMAQVPADRILEFMVEMPSMPMA